MNEAAYIDRWLYSVLHGDGTLLGLAPGGVWADVAPEDTATPFVRFSLQDASDLMVVNGQRVWTNTLYLVAGVADGTSYPAAVADRIDTLLHNVGSTVAPLIVLSSQRESIFRLPETEGERSWRHLGGMFRILAQPS